MRVSMCHCLACQRRTGSAFSYQARFPRERVEITGVAKDYTRLSDDEGEPRTFSFCPECAGIVYYVLGSQPDVVAVPVGAFADPSFPPPTVSVYESRRHAWLAVPESVEQRHD